MRRIVDILVASFALILLSPILVVVAIAVMVSSAGGPFYRGLRVGLNGKPFRMWKFRTMHEDAHHYGPITGPNDARVFPLGRVLRRTKIDELPQFINLLLGDMTLVGPRPESPGMVELYKPWHLAVLSVKPGITGPVQIETVEEADIIPVGVDPAAFYVEHLMDYKIQLYLDHMDNRTFWGDTKVVVSTIGLILHAAFGFPWAPKRRALPTVPPETPHHDYTLAGSVSSPDNRR
jgi:lipopolysaccharide/colanic/teichoic acid biosynthesis glycosyltransferase